MTGSARAISISSDTQSCTNDTNPTVNTINGGYGYGIVTATFIGCKYDLESAADVWATTPDGRSTNLGGAHASNDDSPVTFTTLLESPILLVSAPTPITLTLRGVYVYNQVVSTTSTIVTLLPYNPTFTTSPSQIQVASGGTPLVATMVLDASPADNGFFTLVVSVNGAAAGDSFVASNSTGSCPIPNQTSCYLLWRIPSNVRRSLPSNSRLLFKALSPRRSL